MNFTTSLDADQVLRNSHSESQQAIRVTPVGGTLVSQTYDYVAISYPSGTQEVYQFYSGGSSGSLVATVTINYVDSTKAKIQNVART